MKLYIAGPMSGLPDKNYPAFHAAAQLLRETGYDVSNPADDADLLPETAPVAMWMRLALTRLLTCDALALLPGWQASRGVGIELYVCRSLSMIRMPVNDWVLMKHASLNADRS